MFRKNSTWGFLTLNFMDMDMDEEIGFKVQCRWSYKNVDTRNALIVDGLVRRITKMLLGIMLITSHDSP